MTAAPSQTPEAAGLEPCPFCGGEAWLNDYEAKYSDLPPKSRAPQCRSCGATLGYLTTPAKATEAWNRRVTAASAQARIAELEAEVKKLRTIMKGREELATGLSLNMNALAHDVASDMADRATAAEARADRLAKALERQGNNMAFVLNHANVGNWYDKFTAELAEDRTTLKGADQ